MGFYVLQAYQSIITRSFVSESLEFIDFFIVRVFLKGKRYFWGELGHYKTKFNF